MGDDEMTFEEFLVGVVMALLLVAVGMAIGYWGLR